MRSCRNDDTDAAKEISFSASLLEEELGHSVSMFAYPLARGGMFLPLPFGPYRTTVSLEPAPLWRTVHRPSERFLIGRVMINGDDNEEILKASWKAGMTISISFNGAVLSRCECCWEEEFADVLDVLSWLVGTEIKCSQTNFLMRLSGRGSLSN